LIGHLPHALSVARIPISLLIVAIYDQHSFTRSVLCLLLFVLVFLTDLLDGWIARKYSLQSKFGYLLDGLGDRAFHVSCVLILAMDGILILPLAWMLIFREVSQYAVRIVESDWHSSQSRADRLSTRSYAIILQGAFLAEIGRVLTNYSPPPSPYITGVNLVLFAVAAISFSRIVPRLTRAWRIALDA
jgi:phosphatidylglycerophosphate synthase